MKKKSIVKTEEGMIVLEGVLGITSVIIVLCILLSWGFFIYQKTIFNIQANEVAEEVAMTYRYLDRKYCEDIKISDLTSVKMYRYFISDKYLTNNTEKARSVMNSKLTGSSLAEKKGSTEVTIERQKDDIGRSHYVVTISKKFNFLFEEFLKGFGVKNGTKFEKTVYVESVDIRFLANTIKLTNYVLNQVDDAFYFPNAISEVFSALHSVFKIFS